MAITVKDNSFYLETENTSYIFCVEDGFPVHLYYGERVGCVNIDYLIDRQIYSFFPQKKDDVLQSSAVALEYSGFNTGDYRTCAIKTERADGVGCRLFYSGYEIFRVPPRPKGFRTAAETIVKRLSYVFPTKKNKFPSDFFIRFSKKRTLLLAAPKFLTTAAI